VDLRCLVQLNLGVIGVTSQPNFQSVQIARVEVDEFEAVEVVQSKVTSRILFFDLLENPQDDPFDLLP